MELKAFVGDVLRGNDRALTFEQIAEGVAIRLEDQIRTALNEMVEAGQVERHVGGRNHPWRYSAVPPQPVTRRKL